MRTLRPLTRTVTIAILAAGVAAAAACSADAGIPPVSASPVSLHFKSAELGHAVTADVVLTNQSRHTKRIHFRPQPEGSAFSYADSSCSEPLSPHSSCRITFRFKPKHWGQTTGTLVYLLDNSVLSAHAVHLVGTAEQLEED